MTSIPEWRATSFSSPVATTGGSVTNSGTACRCMFEPISARLASSCSRNGISPAETPTICFGETSMYSTWLETIDPSSPLIRPLIRSWLIFSPSVGTSAGASFSRASSSARSLTTSWVSLPCLTCRYGVIKNPYSSISAKMARLEISPMLVPSGVSIGQMRP